MFFGVCRVSVLGKRQYGSGAVGLGTEEGFGLEGNARYGLLTSVPIMLTLPALCFRCLAPKVEELSATYVFATVVLIRNHLK